MSSIRIVLVMSDLPTSAHLCAVRTFLSYNHLDMTRVANRSDIYNDNDDEVYSPCDLVTATGIITCISGYAEHTVYLLRWTVVRPNGTVMRLFMWQSRC